ncbi:MAG TPA: polysaccharide pyruvyl transferase family protein [Bryobacteraceae bacterium]|nr:polysaccharide pyruvyl transferase family protein [Bryobacteraceae bacterium]
MAHSGDNARPAVAMCGTFDVRNFGDLLFPPVLRHELGRRIPGVEVECFSYYQKAPPEWPFSVSPVRTLPDVMHTFDAVVIGGGHLIRFDKEIAAGYFPPSPDMHHPTSYWLFPAMLALEANVPLIWSAVGASPELPSWGCELLREVLRASTYISVRDTDSQRAVQKLAGDREVHLVPDTVFGIRELHPQKQMVARPYVVIQTTPHLTPYADSMRRLLVWLRSQAYDLVLLPISPALGDDAGILREIVGTSSPVRSWTDPAEAVALIANAAAVVGVSLHLSVTALAYGVPVIRPFENALTKYQALHDLPGVFGLEKYAEQPERVHEAIANRGCRSEQIERFCTTLGRHWDHVSAIVTAPRQERSSKLAAFLQKLPFLLEEEPAAESRSLFRWPHRRS